MTKGWGGWRLTLAKIFAGGGLYLGAAAPAAVCPPLASAADVVKCAVEQSPDALRSRLSVERAEADESKAGQFTNPTLSVQSGFWAVSGPSRGDHQVTLTQPLDWGGSRGARKRTAEGKRRLAEAEERAQRSGIAVEAWSKLHRARHVEEERRFVAEAAQTFARLIALHAGRPSLTPEQQVSLSVFRMAKGDFDLRRSALADEAQTIATYFAVTAGVEATALLKLLPPAPAEWPAVAAATDGDALRTLRARAGVSLAEAEVAGESADTWPQLSVGPYLLAQSENGRSSNLLGVMLNIELPVLSVNSGGRKAAHKGALAAEKELELARREDSAERTLLATRYRDAVAALRATPSAEEIEKEHERLEKLFVRGVIPAPLAIESHRQFLELVRSHNDRELRALQAWWRLEALAGRLP